MENPNLPEALWSILDTRLWHATSQRGLRGILEDGEIRVGVGNRYRASFARNQGGVSLFDFGPTAENVANQANNWRGWFGHQQEERVPVWLEIEREAVLENLLNAQETRNAVNALVKKRIAEGVVDHKPDTHLIPGVEAVHIGPIPLAAISGAFLVDQHHFDLVRRLDNVDAGIFEEIVIFEAELPAYEEPWFIRVLKER